MGGRGAAIKGVDGKERGGGVFRGQWLAWCWRTRKNQLRHASTGASVQTSLVWKFGDVDDELQFTLDIH
jgi:hypothetical protein